jgi:hypothetical protein
MLCRSPGVTQAFTLVDFRATPVPWPKVTHPGGLSPSIARLAAARDGDCSHRLPLGRLALTVGLEAGPGEDPRSLRFQGPLLGVSQHL